MVGSILHCWRSEETSRLRETETCFASSRTTPLSGCEEKQICACFSNIPTLGNCLWDPVQQQNGTTNCFFSWVAFVSSFDSDTAVTYSSQIKEAMGTQTCALARGSMDERSLDGRKPIHSRLLRWKSACRDIICMYANNPDKERKFLDIQSICDMNSLLDRSCSSLVS